MNVITDIPEQVTIKGLTFNKDLTRAPFYVDGFDTLPKMFMDRCRALTTQTAHREKDFGIWLEHSWTDYFERARLIGLGLYDLGMRRGDVVSILSEDNKEWIYTDMGVQCMGGIVSGVYTTDSAAQLEYLVNDSTSSYLFVENDEQLDKYLSVKAKMPGLKKVIVYDRTGLHDFSDADVIFIDDLYKMGEAVFAANASLFEDEITNGKPDETAILVYTSGTTGMPKGVEITHSNIMATIGVGQQKLPVEPGDEQVCFLPLCHILERVVSVVQPIAGRTIVNFAESPETVFENIQEVSPSIFTGVPRVWEKIYSRVSILLQDATPTARWLFDQALKTGKAKAELELAGKPVPASLNMRYQMYDLLVFRNVRRMLGFDKLRRGTSGAAPISAELLLWFRAVGVKIFEGYGMSESAGIITVTNPGEDKLGTVGKPIESGHLRIADDGEVQYKVGNVFKGYWNKPEKTAETFTEDGWLRTGDVGLIDNEGFLRITGRLKDIIITAGGKNITPAEIENRLKFSPYIADAVVVGDRRKFLSCLVMIDQENVEKFAQDKRVPFSNFKSLCAADEVRDLIGSVVEEVNKDFARVEQIKKFRLIDTLLTAEDEELTATMKLKRATVEKKHKVLIDDMYAE
ncbi:AMP-dependent synthetase/ligase [Sulfitobacter aestuariivivens]|uniref:AMP-binding protein n=1 Tax=Sulfitobacter aestuariivivens TaxID=2766981 RepID=A0A927HFI1_9RHOB|nr:AMP-binding protein [Sulfitobacter aestuariivivens]MBD3664961.1 AMP-binding protein [Sulfitobacter aestuariivivens]